MNVTIVGSGAWGTALGLVLDQGQHSVAWWGHHRDHLEAMRRTLRNDRALPGVALPSRARFEPDLSRAVAGAEIIVVAVPSQAMRGIAKQLAGCAAPMVSVTKGIEADTGLTMSGVLQAQAHRARVAVLSGPSLAEEVARGIPTAIVAASTDAALARCVQELFHRPAFRVYTSSDVVGVELGGALKNVVAIAAGVGDGLGFGDNSKAALLTRAIAEIRRLGVACGAQLETFAGLSGLGDLTVTCFSRLSRNRALGERLARGEKLAAILASTTSVAEGVPTARSAHQLARKLGVTTPIIDEVHAILYDAKNPAQAVRDLTARESKAED